MPPSAAAGVEVAPDWQCRPAVIPSEATGRVRTVQRRDATPQCTSRSARLNTDQVLCILFGSVAAKLPVLRGKLVPARESAVPAAVFRQFLCSV